MGRSSLYIVAIINEVKKKFQKGAKRAATTGQIEDFRSRPLFSYHFEPLCEKNMKTKTKNAGTPAYDAVLTSNVVS